MTDWFITGGDGFIGYHVTRKILSRISGDEIISYDAHKHWVPLENSKYPEYQRYRIQNIDNILDMMGRVTRIRGDTTDRGLLKESLEEHRPDVILHLAALPIANVSNKYPTEARRNILDGTITLMDVVRELDYNPRVIYTSSSMVYGDFEEDENENIIPPTEDSPTNPLGLYGSMKLSGEHIVKAYNHRFDIPYVIIRPSAVYGPTDCNRRVTEIFMRNAINGEDLRLDNGGEHRLDFTYVEDTAQGMILAGIKDEALNETFNITRGQGMSIKDLAEIIGHFFPEIKTYNHEIDVYRPNRGALDISKARKKLGYTPQYHLSNGIGKYYYWLKNRGELEQ